MMNENNDVFTMEDEPIASVVQDMRKPITKIVIATIIKPRFLFCLVLFFLLLLLFFAITSFSNKIILIDVLSKMSIPLNYYMLFFNLF